MNICDNLLHKYSKMKNKDNVTAIIIYDDYKKIRNKITKLKRDSKVDYYHRFLRRKKKEKLRNLDRHKIHCQP